MKIEHIAVYTNDIEGMRDFFVRYFGAAADSGYHNRSTDFRSFFLTFEGGARLEIMSRPDMQAEDIPHRLGYHHLAFSTGSREAVDRLTSRLSEDGYQLLSRPRVTGDGYYESSVAGFGGVVIEITE